MKAGDGTFPTGQFQLLPIFLPCLHFFRSPVKRFRILAPFRLLRKRCTGLYSPDSSPRPLSLPSSFPLHLCSSYRLPSLLFLCSSLSSPLPGPVFTWSLRTMRRFQVGTFPPASLPCKKRGEKLFAGSSLALLSFFRFSSFTPHLLLSGVGFGSLSPLYFRTAHKASLFLHSSSSERVLYLWSDGHGSLVGGDKFLEPGLRLEPGAAQEVIPSVCCCKVCLPLSLAS